MTLAKVFNIMLGSTCAALLGSAVASSYYFYFEKPYLSYTNVPFPVVETETEAGRFIQMTVNRCNNSGKVENYTTSHALEELNTHKYVILIPFRVMVAPGCSNATSLINKLPDVVPPGHYRLIGTAEVRGTLITHHVDWYSMPFDVVGKGEK